MPGVELREVELRIAVAEGVLSRAEADELSEEARRKKQSPLALLVEQGRLSEDSFQSILAEAMNDPLVRHAGQDASASTYTMDAPPPASASDPPFPIPGWDRYTCVRFLGQGGMGMVFLVVDPRLRRDVAIKFVRGSDADHVRRLIAEARNQARVKHERVCKVYEVDEVDGKVYIAMQYIAGKPLGQIADELTLEQKVMLVRGAAEGVHAAHSEGIVHRDVKPSNIMVERGEDGELRPYVMDFGLARSAQDIGETMSGAVVGTPRYMAPEQAQGTTTQLDRRADVYSLGATLYHLLTGQPAFPGETVAEVLNHLLHDEPRPPRKHDPGIPVDLEAIVLRCLEKDRSARYDSARALAEDLTRFLTGEPVVARRAGTWYRLRKWLAKHQRLVAVAAVAFVALMVAIGFAIRARLEAGAREQFARQFTEEVASIESTARYSALSRLHDVRDDRKAIQAKMTQIEAEMASGGEVAAGPGHYALGRGYLALDEDARALDHLAAAWNGGLREPRVAYALAQVMGHLYQHNLLAAERVEAKVATETRETRDARKREIGWRYRDPALGFLAESVGDPELASPEYIAALVAFYEGRFDDALQHVDRIGAQPWFYEAPKLRGDILLARAKALRDGGEHDRARRDFADSRAAYTAAAATGQSVAAVHEALAALEHEAMVMEIYGHGDVAPLSLAFDAIGRALAIKPDQYEVRVLAAGIQRTMAEHRANQGDNVEDLLRKALADATRAAALAPRRPEAHIEVARIFRQWGSYRKEHHDDPSEQFRQAIAALDALSPDDRDTAYYMIRGLVFQVWADYEDENGGSGKAHRDELISAYEQALHYADAFHHKDEQRDIYIDVGSAWFKRATVSHSEHPDDDLRRALEALDNAQRIDRSHWVAFYYRGRVHEEMAQRSRAAGRDSREELQNALTAYRAGLTVSPQNAYLHNGVGGVLLTQGIAAWDHGGDPAPLFGEAQAMFAQAIAEAPEQEFGYDNAGELEVQRAMVRRARGEDPSASALAALPLLTKAVDKVPNHPIFRADLATAYSILAEHELEHGRDPLPHVQAGEDALRPALDKNAKDPQVQTYAAEIAGLRARLAARQGHAGASELAQVAEAFERAMALDPDARDNAIVFIRFCRAWALLERGAGRDPEPAVTRGLNQLAQLKGPSPEAVALRASLTLILAQRARDAAERRAKAADARHDFDAAFAANRALQPAWADEVVLAQALAR